MSDKYNINFSDTQNAYLLTKRSGVSDNYYIKNSEHDCAFAVDVTCDNHSNNGNFMIIYKGKGLEEYSPSISIDHNEIRDFKATVSVSPKVALERMIELHDKKVKTVRLVFRKDNERVLIDFDRRIAETYLTICEDFTQSDLTYNNIVEHLQGIIHSNHFRFTSNGEVNLTPYDEESLIYLLTDKMMAKFRELKYQ